MKSGIRNVDRMQKALEAVERLTTSDKEKLL